MTFLCALVAFLCGPYQPMRREDRLALGLGDPQPFE